jgi:predicted transposase/invertase (TIGR01784 family)
MRPRGRIGKMSELLSPKVEKEGWHELASNEPPLRKAMTTLEFLSQDREARMLYEMRQKALRDHISAIEGAREQGRLEGRERGRLEGRVEGRVEVARNMLAMGLDVELIAQATGLAREKLEELKNQTQ